VRSSTRKGEDVLLPKFRLSLLGRFELSGPDGPVDLANKKLAGLLAYLACTAPVPQSRERLATLLWGSHFETQAQQNLRQALFRLRRVLGHDAVIGDAEEVGLAAGLIDCDAVRLQALINEGSGASLAAAADLYRDPLLADVNIAEEAWADWLGAERPRLEGLALGAMIRHARQALQAGNAESALKAANRAIAVNALREDAHRLIVQALAAAGRKPEALKHYQDLIALLKRELNTEPDAVTKSLVADLGRTPPIRAPAVSEGVESGLAQPNRFSHYDKPSIAVLAFQNMSGDPEQEYFSDGISEDLITDLSKISGLMVIARNSSFTYKGGAVDIRAVGRELGVRFVLEGSVRRAGNRIRISAQLIDASNGIHLWAERFDRELSDLFAVEDDVTSQIVNALRVTLSPAERTRLAAGGTSDIKAYDCLLRGREFLLGTSKTRETFERATEFFALALQLDPNYSQAYAGLGWAHLYDYQNGWTGDSGTSLQLARQNVARALEADPNEPLAHVTAAILATFEADLDRSKAEADIALVLNPNCTEAYACLGHICTLSGRPLEALPMLEHAMVLDPLYIQQYLHLLGVANVLAGRYETAAVVLRQRILLVPGTDFSRAVLASALGHLGEIDEARRIWRELKEINPRYAFSEHFARQPYKNKDDIRRIAEGLAKAGLSS
jgi:TolB-like protein/Tfp pilus assembly protein PilF